MGTKAVIGRIYNESDDGLLVDYIGVHYDGYPSQTGRILLGYYDSVNADELMMHGGYARCLKATPKYMDWDNSVRSLPAWIKVRSITDFMNSDKVNDYHADFRYLFDSRYDTWWYSAKRSSSSVLRLDAALSSDD